MEKKQSKIKEFVQSLEEQQVLDNSFELFSGGYLDSIAVAGDKNKHNSHCCNTKPGDEIIGVRR